MTVINFIYYALPLPDGRKKIHLYVKSLGATVDDSPRAQRKGEEDAEKIVEDIVDVNRDDAGEKLLRGGEPPPDAEPIFRFTIGTTYDRRTKLFRYSRVGYERLDWDERYAPIAQLGMEQYDYTMSVLRKREKREYREWEEEHEDNA